MVVSFLNLIKINRRATATVDKITYYDKGTIVYEKNLCKRYLWSYRVICMRLEKS